MPQVDLFVLAYLVGMLLGHVPFLFGCVAGILMVWKSILSVPLYLFFFLIYGTNAYRLHKRPVFWSGMMFFSAVFLSAALSTAWFWHAGDHQAFLTVAPLAVLVPSLAMSCLCFAVLIRRRFPQALRGKDV
ncbi:hypothetical protein FHX15_002061 [Rhizobium sp. BK650]|uniref:hypothetical protein n=1 Tax=Rhizobium sp. BK650 TaxID=2586990 RepID=UPI001799414A|nr:hypothetical protein [Rhizobium sp. BK650]MBB3656833.1 hypothetical protein [Rhizobium sp. BK650]